MNPLGKLRPSFNNTIKGFLSAAILFIFYLIESNRVEQSLYAMAFVVLLGFITIFINYDKIFDQLLHYYEFFQSITIPKRTTENEIEKILDKIPDSKKVDKKW